MNIVQRSLNLLFPPLKEITLPSNSENILDHIRDRVVTRVLRLCVLLGFGAVLVGSVAAWEQQDWHTLILGNLAYLVVLFITINQRLPHKARSVALIVVAFLFLFGQMFNQLTEFTLVTLFAFVVMTTLLLGPRGGQLAFVLSLATMLLMNWRFSTGQAQFSISMAPFNEPLPTILVLYTDWAFFVGLFLFSIWLYFDGFMIAWSREKKATALLAEERDRLAMAFAREQALLEQLTQAHQREIELSRMKSQIITTVSHEFRTPLTVVNNSVELLTNYGDRFDEAKRQEIQQRINESVYFLTELLEDASLVNKAHVQGFVAEMALLPLNGLARRLKKELLQETNDPPNVVFVYDREDETAVCLDYDLLCRATFNLLHNALKYSPPEAKITVEITRTDALRVSVTDAGIGIDPNDAQHIWELFYRGRNTLEKRGMGLGLYLVKQLIQAMDGTVTAVSPGLNQGSTFTIQIPPKPC
ncbi:MAG: hypothetical protein IPM53_04135 [Anaerolineaceae bacterium]|nr:hypothetical protein [Anaerolineaceae bacterium]